MCGALCEVTCTRLMVNPRETNMALNRVSQLCQDITRLWMQLSRVKGMHTLLVSLLCVSLGPAMAKNLYKGRCHLQVRLSCLDNITKACVAGYQHTGYQLLWHSSTVPLFHQCCCPGCRTTCCFYGLDVTIVMFKYISFKL